MATADTILMVLKEMLTASSPGLVTREELGRLEERLDELMDLMDDLEERLSGHGPG